MTSVQAPRATSTSPTPATGPRPVRWGRWLLHLVQMTVAMFVGMFALAPVTGAISRALGVAPHDHGAMGHDMGQDMGHMAEHADHAAHLGHAASAGLTGAPAMIVTDVLMALAMAVGMIVWMRTVGHGWRSTLEMSALMVLAFVPLWALYATGTVDAMGVMMWAHLVMVLAMALYMLWHPREFDCQHRPTPIPYGGC